MLYLPSVPVQLRLMDDIGRHPDPENRVGGTRYRCWMKARTVEYSIAAPFAAKVRRVQEDRRMQKVLIIIGIAILAIGLLWPWLGKLPLGRLPGDIDVDRPGLKVFFPITTMILLSLVLSAAVWLFSKK